MIVGHRTSAAPHSKRVAARVAANQLLGLVRKIFARTVMAIPAMTAAVAIRLAIPIVADHLQTHSPAAGHALVVFGQQNRLGAL